MKEFNLSEKIEKYKGRIGGEGELRVEDVKEFIKRLKEEMYNNVKDKPLIRNSKFYWSIHRIIDKLAGEKLT